jgi:hypothetical protein
MNGQWFFLLESTWKWADPGTTCDGFQEGRHEEGVLLSTMSLRGIAASTVTMLELVVSLPEDRPHTMGCIRQQVLL